MSSTKRDGFPRILASDSRIPNKNREILEFSPRELRRLDYLRLDCLRLDIGMISQNLLKINRTKNYVLDGLYSAPVQIRRQTPEKARRARRVMVLEFLL